MTTGSTRLRSPAALAILGLIAVGIGAWVVLNSAIFAIREVRVLGAREITEDEVRRIAAVRMGENVITFQTEPVTSRLEEHPRIETASVERDLPATLVIRVVERRPSGWVRDPNGIVILAGDGTVLERGDAPVSNLPDFGDSVEVLAPGDRVDQLHEALRVTASMAGSVLRQIESVSTEGSDVVLHLRPGGIVLYGSPVDLADKNRALGRLLGWAADEGVTVRTIDVRVPSAPSLEPVGKGSDPTSNPSP